MARSARIVAGIVAAFVAQGPAAAQSVSYAFEWQGAGGYSMRGAVAFPTALLDKPRVMQGDVECFEAEGFLDGVPIGRWALGMLTEETTWRLTFDTVAEGFVVWAPGEYQPQAWNMDGGGYDCGEGGFGFNIGSYAQDLCLDGDLLEESQVDPGQPLPARPAPDHAFGPLACRGAAVVSRR